MYIQGGRIAGGALDNSCYGEEFADESFCVKHSEIGLLGMCKRSGLKHTNESQFYITTGAPLDFLDNENVVFGRVVSGMHFIESIEKLETVNEKSANGPVKIETCSQFCA
jgi:cyclophilin family peptidyl-prolyl cis-trans isomerase